MARWIYTRVLLRLGIALALSARPAAARYVNDIGEFEIHMRAHKERVIEGARLLLEMEPGAFRGVEEHVLIEYLSLHDVNKLVTPDDDKFRIMNDLFKNYGVDIKTLPKAERDAAQAVVDELNTLDKERAMRFFGERGLLDRSGRPGPIARKLQRLERIADIVDRGMDPVAAEEWGRVSNERGSKYMKNWGDRRLARKLEARYEVEILEPGSYERYKLKVCSRKWTGAA